MHTDNIVLMVRSVLMVLFIALGTYSCQKDAACVAFFAGIFAAGLAPRHYKWKIHADEN